MKEHDYWRDIQRSYRIHQDMGLYICYLCKLYLSGNRNWVRILVDILRMDHHSNQQGTNKIRYYVFLCKQHLLHKVIENKGFHTVVR